MNDNNENDVKEEKLNTDITDNEDAVAEAQDREAEPSSESEKPPVTPDPRLYGWQMPPSQNIGYTPPPTGTYPPQYGQWNNNPNSYYPNYNYYYNNKPPKSRMSGGLKAFLAVVFSLMAVILVAFVFLQVKTQTVKTEENENPFSIPFEFPQESQEEESQENVQEEETPSYTIIPNTDGIKIDPFPTGDELTAKEIYSKISISVVGLTVTSADGSGPAEGSGIVATSDGYVLTNSHVVLNTRSSSVTVTFNDGRSYTAAVVGCDKTTDLAVVKIVDTNDTFIPAEFGDSDSISVGDWVLAIGNPGGSEYASSLTRGIVSAINRKVASNSDNGMTYIQTDAAINPGNSGGALVNMYGQVVGINSSKIVANGFEGMGFSIPITKAKTIVDELMSTGFVEGRTRIGINGQDVDSYTSFYQNVPAGFVIVSFSEDSAFNGTEAQVGDIITAINGTEVTGIKGISSELSKYKPGDRISVTLYRTDGRGNGKSFDVEITLLEDKGETQN